MVFVRMHWNAKAAKAAEKYYPSLRPQKVFAATINAELAEPAKILVLSAYSAVSALIVVSAAMLSFFASFAAFAFDRDTSSTS